MNEEEVPKSENKVIHGLIRQLFSNGSSMRPDRAPEPSTLFLSTAPPSAKGATLTCYL